VHHEPSMGTWWGLVGVRPTRCNGSSSLTTMGLGARGVIRESILGVIDVRDGWSRASIGEWWMAELSAGGERWGEGEERR
jgi:hypothetical protein